MKETMTMSLCCDTIPKLELKLYKSNDGQYPEFLISSNPIKGIIYDSMCIIGDGIPFSI